MLEQKLPDTLSEFGVTGDDITIRRTDPAIDGVNTVFIVAIPDKSSLTLMNLRITVHVEDIGGKVFRGLEDAGGRTLTMKVGTGKTPTDLIVLRKKHGLKVRTAKMAIIVDDLGIKSLDYARRLCALEQTVTLSILPFQNRTSDVVQLASETGTPYMLHMPMEPTTSAVDPGKGAITTRDLESDIFAKLDHAFESVRGAHGLNNHMGSKVTENIRTMEIIVQYLKDNEYFFIDSRTSQDSRGYELSRKNGVKSEKLTRYIDIEDDRALIARRLDELADTALEEGLVIAICHDRPFTVEVLEKKLPELERRGIRFVEIADVVH